MSRNDPSRPADVVGGLLGPAEPELSCDECFEQLDRYVELELAGDNADAIVPGMRPHLEGCAACLDDRDSLAALVAADVSRPRRDA